MTKRGRETPVLNVEYANGMRSVVFTGRCASVLQRLYPLNVVSPLDFAPGWRLSHFIAVIEGKGIIIKRSWILHDGSRMRAYQIDLDATGHFRLSRPT